MINRKPPHINYKKIGIGILALLVSIAVICAIVMVMNIFTLQNIVVQTKDQNIEGLDKIKSTNILFVNVEEIKRTILSKNPWIGEIQVKKNIPRDIIISINKSPVVAYIKTYEHTFEVTNDGVIANRLDTAVPLNIPVVTADGLIIKKGDRLPSDVKNAIMFITNADSTNIQIQESSIDLKSANAHIVLKNGTQVTVPLVKMDQAFPASLQTIVERFRIEGKRVAKIDFRFEKPIITLEGK